MAARFGATIVPLSGIGCNDCVELIADSDDLSRIPILGQRLEENARKQMPPARRHVPLAAQEGLCMAVSLCFPFQVGG